MKQFVAINPNDSSDTVMVIRTKSGAVLCISGTRFDNKAWPAHHGGRIKQTLRGLLCVVVACAVLTIVS